MKFLPLQYCNSLLFQSYWTFWAILKFWNKRKFLNPFLCTVITLLCITCTVSSFLLRSCEGKTCNYHLYIKARLIWGRKNLDSPIDLFLTYFLWFPFCLFSNAFYFLFPHLSVFFLISFWSLKIFEFKTSFRIYSLSGLEITPLLCIVWEYRNTLNAQSNA